MNSKRRVPIPMIAAVLLLCLVMISIHMTSGMFARYSVSANDEYTVQVAEFSVSAEADEDQPVLIVTDGTDDSGKAQYAVKVKNPGETAVHYVAVLNFTGDEADDNTEKFDNSNEQLTFSGDLDPDSEQDHQIDMDMSAYFSSLDDKYSTFSNDDISGESGQAPFELTVTFTQID